VRIGVGDRVGSGVWFWGWVAIGDAFRGRVSGRVREGRVCVCVCERERVDEGRRCKVVRITMEEDRFHTRSVNPNHLDSICQYLRVIQPISRARDSVLLSLSFRRLVKDGV